MRVNALLDTGSDPTLCTERLIDQLSLPSESHITSLTTLTSSHTLSKCCLTDITIHSLYNQQIHILEEVTSYDVVPCQQSAGLLLWMSVSGSTSNNTSSYIMTRTPSAMLSARIITCWSLPRTLNLVKQRVSPEQYKLAGTSQASSSEWVTTEWICAMAQPGISLTVMFCTPGSPTSYAWCFMVTSCTGESVYRLKYIKVRILWTV